MLENAGYWFNCVTPAVEEIDSRALSAGELTLANATRKALAVVHKYRDSLILAADTLVSLEGKVLGKPSDLNHARDMLQHLSGRTHQVYTTVFIGAFSRQFATFCTRANVRFRRLSAREISDYLAKINPLDKAGGYAAQGAGGDIIDSIEGSFSNVVGLPMEQTMAALETFRVRPVGARARSLPALARAALSASGRVAKC